MDPERWERIQALFHDATALPRAERRAWLDAQGGGDAELLAEVLRMLEEDERADSLLDRELAEVAHRMLQAGDASALPPDFGPYRLRGLLGEGGMGAVFLAERPDLANQVAIKILRDGWLSPARRERFASEQRTLARLNHPSIARLYDAGTLPDGTPWIVMEYVDGLPLTRYCAAHARSLPRLLAVFRAVCEAVLHAHQHAVIHRDLKPSNILVTLDGHVKLLDFGIAKRLEEQDAPGGRTRTGEWPMTPAYAAPEQLRGEAVGVQSDVYSLGVVLYELLAGRPPFDLAERTPGEVERIVLEQAPERPSAIARREAHALAGAGRAAWADLDVLCLTAMQKDPERRYRTVDSLIRDLDHLLRGEPLEARPDSLGYRAGKFVGRHRRMLAAVSVTLITVVALVGFYTVRLRTARNQALAEAERTRRIQSFMTDLFQGGDEQAGPSDTLRVVTLLARGEQQARSLGADPAAQADLDQTLGGIEQELGRFERADTLMLAALRVRRAARGTPPGEIARSLVALGVLRADQSRFEDAERLVREGLALSRRGPRPDRAAEARATTALGQVLEDRGAYDAAIQTLTTAARLDSVADLPPADRSATLTELANSLFYAGHYAASDSINQRVLAMDRARFGERHPHVASDLINLGAIQQELGHAAQSERYYRAALDIYRGWYGDQHYETAAALTMVGRSLLPQGRYREAAELLREALAIRERVYGPDHPNVASTLNELGLVAEHEGRFAEAEADFRRMVSIYTVAYHDRHYLIGLALANLATLMTNERRYAEAERLFREALARYHDTLPADHLNVGIVRIKLGRALLRQGRAAEAESESRPGYEIVAHQSDPTVAWLQNARRDLIDEYSAMHQPQRATRYHLELARVGSPDSGVALR